MKKPIYRATGFILSIAVMVVFLVMQAGEIYGSQTDSKQTVINVTVDTALSMNCTSSVAMTVMPGTFAATNSNCQINTNDVRGFVVYAKRNSSPTLQMSGDTATIADITNWTQSSPNAALWSTVGVTQGFGFRVDRSYASPLSLYNNGWWGTDDTPGNAKWAGFPASYNMIASYGSYYGSTAMLGIDYKVDVAASQKSGGYSGTVTYQAVTLP